MAYTAAELVTFYTNGNLGKAPTAATNLLLSSIATQTQSGALTDQAAIDRIIDMLDGTTAVAVQSYQFFTGGTPSSAGLDYLVDSATNTNDLNDAAPGQYAPLSTENRFINFAINLGANTAGAGYANFSATYGTLSLRDVVAVAYETIIGTAAAQAAGIDVNAAINFLSRAENEAYLRAFVAEKAPGVNVELAIRAALVGQIMSAGTTSDVGNYNSATERLISGALDGTFDGGISATAGVDLLTAFPNAPTAGKSFTLTTAADTAPLFAGTAGNDTYIATNTTLSGSDVLAGGNGADVLRYSSTGDAAVVQAGFEASSIETFQITTDSKLGTTFDASNANGLTSLINDNSSSDLTITGLNTLTGMTVRNTSQPVTGGTGSVNTTIKYNAAATAGAATTQAISLENVFNPALAPGAGTNSTITADGVEIFNVTGAGTARSNIAALVSNTLTTVNIAGTQGVTIGGVTFQGTSTGTVNGSTNTGGINVTLANSGTVDVTVTGGTGADRANFSAGFQTKDVYAGGDGIDTIALNNATATTAATLGGTLTAVEILEVTDLAAGTVDMSKFASVNTVTLAVGQNGLVTIDKAAAAITVNNVSLAAGSNLVVKAATDSAADAVTVNYTGVELNETAGTITLNDAETINLSVTDLATDTVTGGLTVASLGANDATKIVVTGNANLTINAIAGPAAAAKALTSFDASGLSTKLTLSGVDFATAGATITASTGGTILTGTGAGKDTINLGAGADTVIYTAIAQSDDDMDTVTGFDVSKDSIDITAAGLVTVGAPITAASQYLGSRASFGAAQGALVGGGTTSAVFQDDEDILWIDSNGDGTLDNRDFRVKLSGVDGSKLLAANLKVGTAGSSFTLLGNATVSATVNGGVLTNPANSLTTNQNDTVTTNIANAVSTVDAAGGTDELIISDAGTLVMGAQLTNFEKVTLSKATTFTANATSKLSIVGSGEADTITLGATDQSVNAGAGVDTVKTAAVTYTKDAVLGGGDGIDVLDIAAGGNIEAATVGTFETLNLNGAATMKAAQYAAFTTVTGAGGADNITFVDAFTGTLAAAVETVTLGNFVNTVTLGAAGQAVAGAAAAKDGDTVNVGALTTTGAIDLGGGTGDNIVLATGANISGSALTGVEDLKVTGSVTLSNAQAAINVIAAGAADQVTFAAADYTTITTDVDVETYVFGDDTSNAYTVSVLGAAQVISATGADADVATVNLNALTFTGTLTNGGGTKNDIVQLSTGANIAGATIGASYETLSLASNASVSMTSAQLAQLTTAAVATAAGVETVVLTTAAAGLALGTNQATIENFTFSAAAADTATISLADADASLGTIALSGGGADVITVNNVSIQGADNNSYLTFTSFTADDKLALQVNATGHNAGFQEITAAGTNLTVAVNSVIEVNTSVGQLVSFLDVAANGAVETLIANAIGNAATGDFSVILYGATGAGIYQVSTTAGAGDLTAGNTTVELIGIVDGMAANGLGVGNFI